jgi:hypothetical protein
MGKVGRVIRVAPLPRPVRPTGRPPTDYRAEAVGQGRGRSWHRPRQLEELPASGSPATRPLGVSTGAPVTLRHRYSTACHPASGSARLLRLARRGAGGEGAIRIEGLGARRTTGRIAPAAAVAAFAAIAIVAYWPVEPLSSSQFLGCACGDQVQQAWFLAWAAHGLTHGVNPFFTSALNYPYGVNLADNTSMPLLGLLAAPVTLLHGPVAAYNVMMRLGFVASATSMMFVTRRFTKRWLPAFLAGLLYGFSPYMVGEGNAHLFLVFVPLPPHILLAVYELCLADRSRLRRRGMVLGALATAHYFISVEVLVTTGLCCAVGLAFAAVTRPSAARARVVPVATGFGWALAVFVPLVWYPLYYYLAGPQHVVGPPQSVAALAPYRADLFGPIVPTVEQWFAPKGLTALGTSYAAGNVGENGSYLGIPLVLVLLAAIARFRRERIVVIVAAVGLCAYVLALGTPLTIDNHATSIPLPFGLLTKVPLFAGMLAARFALYIQLCAALVLAIAVDRMLSGGSDGRRGTRRKVVIGTLAIAALVPLIPHFPYPSYPVDVPAYFSSGLDRAIPTDSSVLTYPYDVSPDNEGMLWQAISGFRFEIVGGEATRRGPGGTGTSGAYPLSPTELQNLFRYVLEGSASGVPAPPITGLGLERVREFFTRWHIETVVVDPIGADPSLVVRYLTVALRRPPTKIGGVDVWYSVSRG